MLFINVISYWQIPDTGMVAAGAVTRQPHAPRGAGFVVSLGKVLDGTDCLIR